MTSSLQVLYFIAATLAPSGAHHVNVTGGSEAYGWTNTSSTEQPATWVYDGTIDPHQVPINNDIAPYDMSSAEHAITRAGRHQWHPHYVLVFDDAHELQKNSQGYVYVVRPGSPNQKTYSFTFSP